MFDDYIMALATKNGAHPFEMPTRMGKPFGDLTKAEVEQWQRDAERMIEICTRLAANKPVSEQDAEWVDACGTGDEKLQAEALA